MVFLTTFSGNPRIRPHFSLAAATESDALCVMETTCLNAAEKAPDAVRKPYRRPSRSVKAQVLTHENIDGRLRARKKFDAIARGVAQDIAGNNQLSTVQLHLIEAFAGVAIHVNNL